MNAEVISVVKTKMKGKWDGYDLTYQGEPYNGRRKDPVTRFVFDNAEFADVVKNLKPGQWVYLTFVKEGKFSNLTGVEVVKTPDTMAASDSPKKGGGNWDETQKRISRSAAMKEATTIVLANAGAKVATKKIDDLVTQIKDVTRELEAFLNFETEEEDAVGKLEGDDVPFVYIP